MADIFNMTPLNTLSGNKILDFYQNFHQNPDNISKQFEEMASVMHVHNFTVG